MDTITHGIVGALIGKSLPSQGDDRTATLITIAGSVFPDSDMFVTLFSSDRLAFIELHRGITHSIVMLPVFAFLFGGLTCLLRRDRKRWLFFSVLYGIGIGSHILLDLITSFGTMIWSPVSNARIAWDTTFIIDVFFTLLALLPQLVAWVYTDRERALKRSSAVWLCLTAAGVIIAKLVAQVRVPIAGLTVAAASVLIAAVLAMPFLAARGSRWRPQAYCRAGVIVLAIYLGLCAIAHRTALARVEGFVRSSGLTVERIAALPSPPSFLQWSGLVETDKGIYRGSIDLAASAPADYAFFPNAEGNQYLEKAGSLPEVKIYLWFARFPWVTYRWSGGLYVIEIRDVQFFGPPRGENPPFTFRVSFDHDGNILSSGLLSR